MSNKTPTRIYAVTNTSTGDVALVRAASPSAAIRHVTVGTYAAAVASQDELVAALGAGKTVQDASAAAAPEPEPVVQANSGSEA